MKTTIYDFRAYPTIELFEMVLDDVETNLKDLGVDVANLYVNIQREEFLENLVSEYCYEQARETEINNLFSNLQGVSILATNGLILYYGEDSWNEGFAILSNFDDIKAKLGIKSDDEDEDTEEHEVGHG